MKTTFEATVQRESGYRDSILLEKVVRSKKIAFFDIDSTLTGNPEVVAEIRAELERRDIPVVFVTSRTEEMLMSEEHFNRTDPSELQRPAPHLFRTSDRLCLYQDPKTIAAQAPFVDADGIAASTGTRIFLRQKGGGYRIDSRFEERMKQTPEEWRSDVSELITYIGPEFEITISNINREGNYEQNLVDVYPPNYRVLLEFFNRQQEDRPTGSTAEGSAVTEEEAAVLLAQKRLFQDRVEVIRQDPHVPTRIKEIVENILVTDDSNPDKGLFLLYVTPAEGSKRSAVDQMLDALVQEAGVNRSELEVILAGDSYPDVAMGLEGAQGTNATFVLASGSRLSDVFVNPEVTHFAGENFSEIKNRLAGDLEAGVLTFVGSEEGTRRVVIGSRAFPGMTAPESVLATIKTLF